MKNVVIFGGGEFGKRAFYRLRQQGGVRVVAFLDNDMNKWGSKIENVVVMPPREILFSLSYDEIIICSSRFAHEIFMQLAGEFRIDTGKIHIPYFVTRVRGLEDDYDL